MVAALAAFGLRDVVALPQTSTSTTYGNNQTSPTNHIVHVGRADHVFSPDVTIADVGDTITFLFYPLNHSVVKMDPEFPCKPYEMIHSKGTGFWSGFQFLQAFRDPPPSYNITINDTQPLWFYCSAIDSCIKFQMVGVINPDNNTFPIAKVKGDASQADFSLSPGEPWPAEGGAQPNPDGNGTSTGGGGGGSDSKESSGLSTGAIAGIAIGAVIALALVGLLFFFVGRNKKGTDAKSGAQTDPASQAGVYSEAGLMQSHPPGSEHPPNYQDPRYSSLSGSAPAWPDKTPSALAPEQSPNRLSELPASYDPVEIYTPMANETPTPRDQNQE